MHKEKVPLEHARQLLLRAKETNTWEELKEITGCAINTLRSVLEGDRTTTDSVIYQIIAALDCPTVAWELAKKNSTDDVIRRLADIAMKWAGRRDYENPTMDYFDPPSQHVLIYAGTGEGVSKEGYLAKYPSHASVFEFLEESKLLSEVANGVFQCPYFKVDSFVMALKTCRTRLDAVMAFERNRLGGTILDFIEEVDLEGFIKIRNTLVEAYDKSFTLAERHRSNNGIKMIVSAMTLGLGVSEEEHETMNKGFR